EVGRHDTGAAPPTSAAAMAPIASDLPLREGAARGVKTRSPWRKTCQRVGGGLGGSVCPLPNARRNSATDDTRSSGRGASALSMADRNRREYFPSSRYCNG